MILDIVYPCLGKTCSRGRDGGLYAVFHLFEEAACFQRPPLTHKSLYAGLNISRYLSEKYKIYIL